MLRAIVPNEFPWLRTAGYTFSLGLTQGEGVWLSGMSASAFDPDAQRVRVRGDMREQAQVAYAKVERILEAEGLSFLDVTRITENVTAAGIDHYETAAEVRREVFGAHQPVVVTVCVDHLLRRKALIEVEISASRGGGIALKGGLRESFGGTVYLPTILPLDDNGALVDGELPDQYRACFTRARAMLHSVGLGVENIVRTVDYTTPATRSARRSMIGVREDVLDGNRPSAAGILMSRLPVPGSLVSMDIVASRRPAEVINPGWSNYDETLTYSPAVRAGDVLWMSGFGALDPEAHEVAHPGDVVGQAQDLYRSVNAILESVGAGPEAIVDTVEYVAPAGLEAYRGVAEVRRELLREPWPASTGIVCAGLLNADLVLDAVPTAVLSP